MYSTLAIVENGPNKVLMNVVVANEVKHDLSNEDRTGLLHYRSQRRVFVPISTMDNVQKQ